MMKRIVLLILLFIPGYGFSQDIEYKTEENIHYYP